MLNLESLLASAPEVLTQAMAGALVESCKACLKHHNHQKGTDLRYEFPQSNNAIPLTWGPELTDEDFEKYRNRNRRTDDGACALSLLLIPELLGYVVIEQSSTGDGVDYYLRRVDDDSDLIFNTDGTAKLEVSGIHKRTSTNNPRSRINTKIKRIEKVRSKDPAGTTRNDTVICIVEFGDPAAVAEIV